MVFGIKKIRGMILSMWSWSYYRWWWQLTIEVLQSARSNDGNKFIYIYAPFFFVLNICAC